ncbi:MAG: hypothetical protein LCH20_01610 [Proteobacteria bacterium]|nr:hypothetical protein [Pseudomonadota bacterium]
MKLEEYSTAARIWDEWYARYYGLATYPGKAVRVEQGEYGVVNRDTALGTYNVRQCVVVYLATEGMHGLVHIDGHTEIKSLKEYLDALGIVRDQILPHIKIIGARSKTIMGLNDSEANIRKVNSFLLEVFGQSGIDIGTLVEARPELTDFVISGPGPEEIHDRCLVRGEYNKEQALHTIQEIKRKDSYIGTYPVARANDGHSKCIFLDERAIVKLNEYLKNPEKDKVRDKFDIYNYQAFDAAIPVILEEWNQQLKLLSLSHCTPLFIGDGANQLNQSTLIPPPKYTNSANIDFVLQYCRSMDTDLSFHQVKGHLVGQDGVNIDCEVFGFDAGITAKKLLKIISRCSIKLYKLLMLHPQGAYDLDQEPYKIEQIKAILEPKELELLQQVIVGFNEISLSRANDLAPVEYNEQISIQFQSRAKPLSRKQKMLLSHGEHTVDQKVGRLCGELQLDSGQISSSIRRRCTECKEIKIHEAQIKDSSNFSLVQTDFLSSLNLPNFSTTSIGMHLSEFASSSLYACDPDVGAKFLQVLVEVETLGTQEVVGHSEDFE